MTDHTVTLVRRLVGDTIAAKEQQGHVVTGLAEEARDAAGLDALLALAGRLRSLPTRPDWPYREPLEFESILSECDPDRPSGPVASSSVGDHAERIRAAFIASVCGCVLGKPVEVSPTLEELRAAAAHAEQPWPLDDYILPALLDALGRRNADSAWSTRGDLTFVPPDDDINFRIIGMLLIERYGIHFGQADVLQMWTHNLPIEWVWASNRTFLLKASLHWRRPSWEPVPPAPLREWVETLNPYDEDCGAVIRVDAYGYACPGRPDIAAELAWRDASVTHTRTGVYSSMFQAAAVAAMLDLRDPIEAFEVALMFVPSASRLYETLDRSIAIVREASGWGAAYGRLEAEFGRFGHCKIHFELGTVINTVRFASDVGEGLGLQVSQGNDTDSFGASAGSLLGARFGPGAWIDSWTRPFHDDLRTTVATFHERSLKTVARRMAALPTQWDGGVAVPPHASDPLVS